MICVCVLRIGSELNFLHNNRRQSQPKSGWGSIALVVGIPALITVLFILVAIFLCRHRGKVRKTRQSSSKETAFSGENLAPEHAHFDSKWSRSYDKAAYKTHLLQQNVSSQSSVPASFHHPVSTHPSCLLHHHSPPPMRTNVVLSIDERWPTSTPSSHFYQLPLSPRDSLNTGTGGGNCGVSADPPTQANYNYQLAYDRCILPTPPSPCWRQQQDMLPVDEAPTSLCANYKEALHPTCAFQTHLHYGQC